MNSQTRLARCLWLAVLPLAFYLTSLPVQAQEVPTSTPDADGLIYVEVQPDDSLWAIAARAGLTIPELLALNELDESVVLRPGDRLIIARVEPPLTATPDIPTPTLPPPSVTPTAARPRTAMCLLAYYDQNRNGEHDDAEPLRPNVAFTLYNEQQVVANYITDGQAEPYCIEELTPGAYHVTRSKGQNETLTTEGDWALTLSEGSALNLAFGSYDVDERSSEPTPGADEQLRTRLALTPEATPSTVVSPQTAENSRTRSLMIGLALAVFALLASLAVLTLFFVQKRRERQE